jgi:exopolysaccharide biosynthesis polyprenyl glycosylphosphotransferase
MNFLRRQILLFAYKAFDLMVVFFSFIIAAESERFLFTDFTDFSEIFHLKIITPHQFVFFIGYAFFWHLIFLFSKLYTSKRLTSRFHEIFDVVKAITIGTLILFMVLLLYNRQIATSKTIITFWLSASGIMIVSRIIMRYILAYIRLRNRNIRFLVIVGTNARAIKLANRLKSDKKRGYAILGFVDDDWEKITNVETTGIQVVSNLKNFTAFVRDNVVDEVLLCLPLRTFYAQALEILTVCEEQGVKIRLLPMFLDSKLAKARIEKFDGEFMITLSTNEMAGWTVTVKRILDITASLLGLFILLPVFIIVGCAIKLTSPGPVFFIQDRIGLNKRRFKLFKFRTMILEAEQLLPKLENFNEVTGPVFKIKNDPRITTVGKFLRKTSCDELPQLINVLKGDMSLVGPRPLPVRDFERFDQDWHRRRFSVKPGMTCLWQVLGRSSIQFDQWMALDMKYIDQWSLQLDFLILVKTIPAVFKGKGAA